MESVLNISGKGQQGNKLEERVKLDNTYKRGLNKTFCSGFGVVKGLSFSRKTYVQFGFKDTDYKVPRGERSKQGEKLKLEDGGFLKEIM